MKCIKMRPRPYIERRITFYYNVLIIIAWLIVVYVKWQFSKIHYFVHRLVRCRWLQCSNCQKSKMKWGGRPNWSIDFGCPCAMHDRVGQYYLHMVSMCVRFNPGRFIIIILRPTWIKHVQYCTYLHAIVMQYSAPSFNRLSRRVFI